MTCLLDYTPSPPEWRLPWAEMEGEYPWLAALSACPQDPIFHAEGDVGTHTRMVSQELAALDGWRTLSSEERRTVFAAAVLHDVGKPDCTRIEEDGRISSRGHSRRGAILARDILWRQRVPFAVREQITGLIRFHQVPYFLIQKEDPIRLAIEVSYITRGGHLALLAEADVRGRICQDQQTLLDNVALFHEQMLELGCLSSAYPFASDHARLLYFRDEKRHPQAPAYAAFRSRVVLMSGLPGSGKDTHIRTHYADWPVISLDEIRVELGVDPGEDQAAVVERARERTREHLRRGERFVWNATNISRQLRGIPLDLFLAYQAEVKIVYVEVPPEVLFAQNHRRQARVPEAVMERLIGRWEVPDRTEAHEVEWCVRE